MQYLGGKSRLAKHIANVIVERSVGKVYLEPFVGGGTVLEAVANRRHFFDLYAGDAHPDLIEMWRAAAAGWVPPEDLDEEVYASLRHAPPSALRAFAGFACSFGGKWFGGYARAPKHGRNYAASGSRVVARQGWALRDVTAFECRSYDEWHPGPHLTVYCDPPYRNVTGYNGMGAFDSDAFWRRMTAWVVENGATVLVSEFQAPADWVPVWSVARRVAVVSTSDVVKVDTVFMHESQA